MIVSSKEDVLVKSSFPIPLCGNQGKDLLDYFYETWELYEWLFSSIKDEASYYLNPDPLRHPLIFYLGHTAAFYINKLQLAGLIVEGVNPFYEVLFARGVDPDSPDNLEKEISWPSLQEVRTYRKAVFKVVEHVIESADIPETINQNHPLWALFMSFEHDRIHFETSSVLIRQLACDLVQKPMGWEYAPSFGKPDENELIEVEGGCVALGKPEQDTLFGWDNEYGQLNLEVSPFAAYKNLVTNAEYLAFVESGAYNQQKYWTQEAWTWKQETQTTHPKFWVLQGGRFSYRAMFDVIENAFGLAC